MNRGLAAISIDIDTLDSIYQGRGCRRPGGYTGAELRMGLANLTSFFSEYGISTTLFMVGRDFQNRDNHDAITAVAEANHEIANHTMNHAQGFRLLPLHEKEAELAGMEEACERLLGFRPVGFRAPGWNMGDDAIGLLERRGYLYDSSVHPTILMPLFKALHWRSMRTSKGPARTTMGHLRYMLAPTTPYRASSSRLGRRGTGSLVEIPVTVSPLLRLPFWATFLLASGHTIFEITYRALRALGMPIQFMFHLSDFVDYGHPDLADQVPRRADGVYIPQALTMPLNEKLAVFRKAVETIAADHSFSTLRQWAMDLS